MKRFKSLAGLGSFKELFKRNKAFLGVEVDAGEIRAVELAPDGEGFRMAALVVLPGPELGPGGVPDENSLTEVLKELAERAGFSAKQVVSVLPGTVVIERLVHMPPMPARELTGAVRFEAGQLIPVPLDDMLLRHVVLGETAGPEKQLNVLVAAAPQDSVYRFHQAFNDAGLTLAALDLPALALWRIFCGPGKGGWCPGRQVIVDVNAAVTRCAVVEEGSLLFIRTAPVGCREIGLYADGSVWKGNLSGGVEGPDKGDGVAGHPGGRSGAAPDLNYGSYPPREPLPEAAAAKDTINNGAAADEELDYLLSPVGFFAAEERSSAAPPGRAPGAARRTLPAPAGSDDGDVERPGLRLDELVIEIKRSLEFFRGLYAGRPVDRLVLTGPAARRPDLPGLLSFELDMDVITGRPPLFPSPEAGGQATDFDPALAVAAGLSLWGVER
ncbi:pilus assembly protein PilM [Desulfotomaculum copahuensis]|nr:pilus assembly protein PilM [Desulfotomaculum copahuensis]